MLGEGTYAMTLVKEVKATEDYLGLSENTRKCQHKESFQECTSRQYMDAVEKKCNCVPYRLRDFAVVNQVLITPI